MKFDQGCLSVFTNDEGGIRDDLIVTKVNDESIHLVTNAGCIDKDLPYLLGRAAIWRMNGKDVAVCPPDGKALIAVQGPQMLALLQPKTDAELSKLSFMHSITAEICGISGCRITRCGYTGEDGVEISVSGNRANELVEALLASRDAQVYLAGLGARDVLRLEAGLCLYGNDINEDTTPVEAGLTFVIAKRRRETNDFPGAAKILSQIERKGGEKKRIGLLSASSDRALRANVPIIDPNSKTTIGFVTSGCPSPTLKQNISMAYVDSKVATIGKVLAGNFGNKLVQAIVTKMPFVSTNYFIVK